MIKKTITYEDYNGDEVSEDFYFNLTKLEMMETELEVGGFEDVLEQLQKTEDAKKAYELFKDILLSSVGVKSPDGRRFIKNDEIRADFEQSPALGELIFEFLQEPSKAGSFVEGLLPAKLVAEVKAQKEKEEKNKPSETVELPAGEPQLEKDEGPKKAATEYTRDELMAMTDEEFIAVAGSDPLQMDQSILQIAYLRKNRSKIEENKQ